MLLLRKEIQLAVPLVKALSLFHPSTLHLLTLGSAKHICAVVYALTSSASEKEHPQRVLFACCSCEHHPSRFSLSCGENTFPLVSEAQSVAVLPASVDLVSLSPPSVEIPIPFRELL